MGLRLKKVFIRIVSLNDKTKWLIEMQQFLQAKESGAGFGFFLFVFKEARGHHLRRLYVNFKPLSFTTWMMSGLSGLIFSFSQDLGKPTK